MRTVRPRQQREDMKHSMVKMLCGELYTAPLREHPQEILDIGTGTGIWAIESKLPVFDAADSPPLPLCTLLGVLIPWQWGISSRAPMCWAWT